MPEVVPEVVPEVDPVVATAPAAVMEEVATDETAVDPVALEAMGYEAIQGIDYIPGPEKTAMVEVRTTCRQ